MKQETELQRRVAKAKVDGIDNAYVAISASYEMPEKKFSKHMSLFYVSSDTCIVEWEPEFGPITVIIKCDKDWKDEYYKAKPHWYFDYFTGNQNWTQLAVDERRLKEAYVRGDYKYIFGVLSEYGE